MSKSLETCQQDSSFEASLFDVVYTPNNDSVAMDISIMSSIEGKVVFDFAISAYGYQVLRRTVNPCNMDLGGLCPMVAGGNTARIKFPIEKEAARQIPDIAYNIPDLDANVRIYVNLTATGQSVACLNADVSNGKTVNLLGVKWATAIVAGLALLSSAVFNGLGHFNTAAHVAANSLSLFNYFQAQAIVGLTGVHLPPIVQAWTLNFQWSMGIIRVGFLQDLCTWYQRATGGSPSRIFSTLATVSVHVTRRSMDYARRTGLGLLERGLASMPQTIATSAAQLLKRGNIVTGSGAYAVHGIQRVAFQSHIETTNLFLTGLIFFYLLLIFAIIGILAFKGACELCSRQMWMKKDRFLEFRNEWRTILKGVLFRISLIGFPQVCILCLWEFTQVDSPAEATLAAFVLLGLTLILAWGAYRVICIARHSALTYGNPAYILFSDSQALNKWGFLYIQFRASAYYFILPILGYTLTKAILIALAQHSGIAQAVGLMVLEAGALITASVMRPWMDKSTNSFNIAISVVGFLNAICLLMFSNVFGAPPILVGIFGVVLFILNAAFSLILLLMVTISTMVTFFRRNPDARYRSMADDRASFVKSQTQLNIPMELAALGATARGEGVGYESAQDLTLLSGSRRCGTPNNMHSVVGSQNSLHQETPRSPVDPSLPLFPAREKRAVSPLYPTSPSTFNRSGSSLGRDFSSDKMDPHELSSPDSPRVGSVHGLE